MSRDNTVQVRLSDREIKMLQEIKDRVGTTNASEGMRYSLAYTHAELVLKGKANEKNNG